MSQHISTVNAWLKELASLTKIDSLELNDQGVCAIKFGARAEIVFELPADSEVLHLYCPMGEVPSEDPAPFLRRLLEWNMLGLETQGASFAVDPASNQALLCYNLPLTGSDILTFQNTVGNFAEVCERFCNELQEGGVPDSSSDFSLNNMSFLRG